jgi:ABC-type Fe3+-hydroxamate transport system substrate-binding protein
MPDVTELAFALGAGDRVVAAPPAADHPEAVARLPRIAPSDIESIVAARPDLVLASAAGSDPRVVERLAALGLRVCTVDVTSCERLADAARLVGRLVGNAEGGQTLAATIEGRCRAAGARAASLPERNALYVIWWEPLIVAAPGTFHDDLLRRARLVNLAPTVSALPARRSRTLLDPRLEVVVAADEPDLRDGLERSRLAGRARSGSVGIHWLPAAPASRPGPRLAEALDALVAAREANP